MIWVDDATKQKYDFFKAFKALLSYSHTLVYCFRKVEVIRKN